MSELDEGTARRRVESDAADFLGRLERVAEDMQERALRRLREQIAANVEALGCTIDQDTVGTFCFGGNHSEFCPAGIAAAIREGRL